MYGYGQSMQTQPAAQQPQATGQQQGFSQAQLQAYYAQQPTNAQQSAAYWNQGNAAAPTQARPQQTPQYQQTPTRPAMAGPAPTQSVPQSQAGTYAQYQGQQMSATQQVPGGQMTASSQQRPSGYPAQYMQGSVPQQAKPQAQPQGQPAQQGDYTQQMLHQRWLQQRQDGQGSQKPTSTSPTYASQQAFSQSPSPTGQANMGQMGFYNQSMAGQNAAYWGNQGQAAQPQARPAQAAPHAQMTHGAQQADYMKQYQKPEQPDMSRYTSPQVTVSASQVQPAAIPAPEEPRKISTRPKKKKKKVGDDDDFEQSNEEEDSDEDFIDDDEEWDPEFEGRRKPKKPISFGSPQGVRPPQKFGSPQSMAFPPSMTQQPNTSNYMNPYPYGASKQPTGIPYTQLRPQNLQEYSYPGMQARPNPTQGFPMSSFGSPTGANPQSQSPAARPAAYAAPHMAQPSMPTASPTSSQSMYGAQKMNVPPHLAGAYGQQAAAQQPRQSYLPNAPSIGQYGTPPQQRVSQSPQMMGSSPMAGANYSNAMRPSPMMGSRPADPYNRVPGAVPGAMPGAMGSMPGMPGIPGAMPYMPQQGIPNPPGSDTVVENIPARVTTRGRKQKYTEGESDDDVDPEEAEFRKQKQQEKDDDGEVIDRVLDHEEFEEKDEITQEMKKVTRYLIKWRGKSHIHDTWDLYEDLRPFKGFKKLDNYLKQLKTESEREKFMSPEEVEQLNIAREMKRQQLDEYLLVDRIVNTRTTERGTEYFVKWKELAYEECTWEIFEDIKEAQPEIDKFLQRQQQQQIPRVYYGNNKLRPYFRKLERQPEWLKGGTLRDYQLDGLNWLVYSWCNNTNVILADEMGLGKTIQSLSICGYLQYEQNIPGPFLVVVPLSTVSNWENECAKWLPDCNAVCISFKLMILRTNDHLDCLHWHFEQSRCYSSWRILLWRQTRP